MTELYGWKPPVTIGAKRYLEQRDAETIAAERAVLTDRYKRSVTWLEKYHTRGRKTAINWSPSITLTTTEETTSEEVHHQENHVAQAAEVGVEEGVGDAPEECSAPGIAGSRDEPVALRGQPAEPASAGRFARECRTDAGVEPAVPVVAMRNDGNGGSRFAREGHTDFGDGDTPF